MEKLGLLLDISGTLVDNIGHMVSVYNEARTKIGLPKLEDYEIIPYLDSNNYTNSLSRLGFVTRRERESFREMWNRSLTRARFKLYSGARVFMKKLSSYEDLRTVMITGDYRETVKNYQKMGLINGEYEIITRDDVNDPKPGKDHILAGMEATGAERVMMLDDMPDTLRSFIEITRKPDYALAAQWGLYSSRKEELKKSGATIVRNFDDALSRINEVRMSLA